MCAHVCAHVCVCVCVCECVLVCVYVYVYNVWFERKMLYFFKCINYNMPFVKN